MVKSKKGAALVAMAGMGSLFGGCLGFLDPQTVLLGAVQYVAYEFVLDNDGVFDLWEDGGEAAAAE